MKDKEIELKDGHANIENIYDFFKQYGLGESDVTYEGIPSLMKKLQGDKSGNNKNR